MSPLRSPNTITHADICTSYELYLPQDIIYTCLCKPWMLEQVSKVKKKIEYTILLCGLNINLFYSWICLRRQWVAVNHIDVRDDKEQSTTTLIEWCDDADDWGEESNIEENGNVAVKSQAIEICAPASAELENADVDENVVAEQPELPNTDVLQLLDSRKEIPSVSFPIA